ncbi:MAG: S8 family peptidase [Candidatus Aminicenantales bacterium]|jgi:subtilisin family serine protease
MNFFGKKAFRPVLVLCVLLLLGLGSANSSLQKAGKRNDRSGFRADRVLRVERPGRSAKSRLATDRILVKFRPGVSAGSAEGILQYHALGKIRRIAGTGVYRVQIPPNVTVREMLTVLRQNPEVEYAGPDYRTRLFTVPNDTYFSAYQYNLSNRGGILNISPDTQPQMTAGADIKATPAWDVTKGDAGTIIAVVDTGVDMSHAELKNKVVSTGYDFINGDSDATDDNSHGTWVAGIAAAETNNNEGIAGVAWNCKILPVKVMDADGNGYYDQLIEGIIWAADNGAKVINISAGGDADDPALKEACKYAYDKNVVVVAAAGNDGTSVSYPAAYDDYVLAVAATDYNDAWASFSSPGSQVDVAAPGVWILGPAPQWYVGPDNLPYVFGSGTSGSSPQVAGLAALLISHKPWLTPNQVMNIIRYTADDVNKAQYPGKDDHLGYGRINMGRALVAYKLTR